MAKDKRAPLDPNLEPIALRNQRDTFKISSCQSTPLHTIEPGSWKKVVSQVLKRDGNRTAKTSRSASTGRTRERPRGSEGVSCADLGGRQLSSPRRIMPKSMRSPRNPFE